MQRCAYGVSTRKDAAPGGNSLLFAGFSGACSFSRALSYIHMPCSKCRGIVKCSLTVDSHMHTHAVR